jgi:hypothetical protein
MFLHEAMLFPQINLDLTEWVNINENNLRIQHHCLYTTVLNENTNDSYEIISFCMSDQQNGILNKLISIHILLLLNSTNEI